VRYLFLQQLLKRPPRALVPYLASSRFRGRFDKQAGKDIGKAGSRGSKSLRKRLLSWNKTVDDNRPIPLSVQRDIATRLQPEVDKLSRLIGRDLSNWLQPR
jgi:hypothetical protein